MSDYTKSTNFTSKDSLSVGNPLKIVKGTEIDTEFNNIATAVATKADIANPTFTGVPSAPTASAGTNTTQIATTAFVTAQIADDAPTKTGGGASGTWAINVTGNASSATGASGSQFSTATTASEGQLVAGFSGQHPAYLYNNATAWGLYSVSGGNILTYIRGTGTASFTGNAATATTDSQHFGVSQTWQDVTGSRAANTTYVNTTGKPIMVNIYWGGSNGAIVATINGVGFTICSNGGFSMAGNVIVPTGATYSINAFSTWHELR